MKIEFVSYDGRYPNLCSGTLTLKLDGIKKTFGYGDCDYPQFWTSGGCVWFDNHSNEHVDRGAWELRDDALPAKLQPLAEQLIDVFNRNVEYGCCGGCV